MEGGFKVNDWMLQQLSKELLWVYFFLPPATDYYLNRNTLAFLVLASMVKIDGKVSLLFEFEGFSPSQTGWDQGS